MQNWFRRKELVSPPYDKCGIFAKQHLEFHAGDPIGSEHRQECLNREAFEQAWAGFNLQETTQ
jgi:hypothetical protein